MAFEVDLSKTYVKTVQLLYKKLITCLITHTVIADVQKPQFFSFSNQLHYKTLYFPVTFQTVNVQAYTASPAHSNCKIYEIKCRFKINVYIAAEAQTFFLALPISSG